MGPIIIYEHEVRAVQQADFSSVRTAYFWAQYYGYPYDEYTFAAELLGLNLDALLIFEVGAELDCDVIVLPDPTPMPIEAEMEYYGNIADEEAYIEECEAEHQAMLEEVQRYAYNHARGIE